MGKYSLDTQDKVLHYYLPEIIYKIDTSYQAVNMDRRAEFLFFPKASITQEI
jgi:hypothetical protein